MFKQTENNYNKNTFLLVYMERIGIYLPLAVTDKYRLKGLSKTKKYLTIA